MENNQPGTSRFKYHEDEILQELHQYIDATYGAHYVGKNNLQTNDFVLAGDRVEARGFWRWNALKYLMRYGKKNGTDRKDLLKAVHYVILLLHLNDLESGNAATVRAQNITMPEQLRELDKALDDWKERADLPMAGDTLMYSEHRATFTTK